MGRLIEIPLVYYRFLSFYFPVLSETGGIKVAMLSLIHFQCLARDKTAFFG
jgi:hypothetical protein